MSTISISLPDEMTNWIEAEMERGGFASASDFFGQLLRDAKEDKEARDLRWQNLLLEGVESGESEPMTNLWWTQLRDEVNGDLKKHGAAPVDWEKSE